MSEFVAWLREFFTEYQTAVSIIVILAVAVFLHRILRLLLTRTVNHIVQGVKRSQAVDLTEELSIAPKLSARAVQRTRTLGSVGRHFITWIIAVTAVILILSQLGVNLAALLTSAGIVAGALAFGAQSLVKDFLNGLFMVSEDQLGVGDWITIGEISGTVEDVGIRVT